MHNIQQAMKQAQELQKKFGELQSKLDSKLETETVEGTAGGNMVRFTLTCKGVAKKIEIDKSLLDPNEKEMLEDLIVTAHNNANKNADLKAADEKQKIFANSGLPMDLLNQSF